MRSALLCTVILLTATLVAGPARPAEPEYYDEMWDGNQLREHYQLAPPPPSKGGILNFWRKPYQAATFPLAPVPRIVPAADSDLLRRGLLQRAETLRRLLREIHGGTTEYLKVIPRATMQRALARTHSAAWVGKLNPRYIAFSYGADTLRKPNGEHVVSEDNLGPIGGPGLIAQAQTALLGYRPELRRVMPEEIRPEAYYSALTESLEHFCKGPGRIVVLIPDEDPEYDYFAAELAKRGTITIRHRDAARLRVTEEGLWVKDPAGHEEPVAVVVPTEHLMHWDPGHPLLRTQLRESVVAILAAGPTENGIGSGALTAHWTIKGKLEEAQRKNVPLNYEEIEKMLRSLSINAISYWEDHAVPGLTEAILAGKVASTSIPGTDVAGDKEIHGYIDALTELYTGQKPLLAGVPSRSFALNSSGDLDSRFFEKALSPEHLPKLVIKVADGGSGKMADQTTVGVLVGPAAKPGEISAMKENIRREPGRFIAQEYVSPSRIDGDIVDLRFPMMVLPDQIVTSPIPITRGSPYRGTGRMNLSGDGKVYATFVESAAEAVRRCTRRGLSNWSHSRR